MKKNFKFYAIVWAILLAIFNIAVFVSPNEAAGMNKFGGAFWVGYIFITIAFIGQLAVSFFAFQAKNLQKFFYKIPLIKISWSGLILTLIFGTACMAIPDLPNWVGIILCFAILGFNAISIAKANLAADLVSEIDDKVKEQTFFIRSLTIDVERLVSSAKDDATKKQLTKVYEAVRYSDPMSSPALSRIEDEVLGAYNDLAAALEEGKDISELVDTILSLVQNRNSKCKMLK